MTDCDTCKRYLESGGRLSCYKAEYYYPGCFFYCRPQMRWALSCYPLLDDGWPPDPEGSSYTDPAIRSKQVKIPKKYGSDLRIEIDCRLRTCGEDGQDLLHQLVNYGQDCLLTRRAERVLNYISGWRRRTSYRQWKYEKEKRQNYPLKIV